MSQLKYNLFFRDGVSLKFGTDCAAQADFKPTANLWSQLPKSCPFRYDSPPLVLSPITTCLIIKDFVFLLVLLRPLYILGKLLLIHISSP